MTPSNSSSTQAVFWGEPGAPAHELVPHETLARGSVRPDVAGKLAGRPGYLSDCQPDGALHGAILGSPHRTPASLRSTRPLPAPCRCARGGHRRRHPGRSALRPARGRTGRRCATTRSAAWATRSPPWRPSRMELARQALALIDVHYEVLPVSTTPNAPCCRGASPVHAMAATCCTRRATPRRPGAGRSRLRARGGGRYETPRQMHAYLETEGGVAEPDGSRRLRWYFGGHNPARERQVDRRRCSACRTIRCGGRHARGRLLRRKGRTDVQPIAALLASRRTQRAVRLHLTRPQSTDSGVKRHPMLIRMRTGCDAPAG
jgi:CO/xanthine dehydrogenase Mo-binding subunit